MAADPKTTKPAEDADEAADEQAAIDEAANALQAAPERSPGEQEAEDAELARQAEVEKAVAKANKRELPKLGGPLKNPGLGI